MSNKEIYIIAEIGNNHQGSVKHAMKLIKSAKDAGANAVKTQKRDNKSLYTKTFFNQVYDNPNSFAQTYGEHREKLELNKSDYKDLVDYSKEVGIDFFATPFDLNSLNFLEEFNFKSYKIASADVTNTILQTEIAKTKKEIFLSTGGATLEDVKRAKENIFKHNEKLTIMQCTASYPVDIDNMNLKVLETYKKNFPRIRLGLSDHENGIDAGPIAYMLGARVFEKHFTDDNDREGPDHKFALNPTKWREMVNLSLEVFETLGDGKKKVEENEQNAYVVQRRSIVCKTSLEKGHVIEESDLDFLRPCPENSFHPYEQNLLIGKTLSKNKSANESILKEDIC